MDSFKDIQRQIRIAFLGIFIVLLIGTSGYVIIEGKSVLNALWLTVITLTTVGYGDDYARSEAGRIFTIILILTGFGVVAYGLQAIATLLVSPQIREFRQRRRTEKIIRNLNRHYIICGHGDLVDQTITYLLQSVQMRLAFYDEEIYGPIDNFLDNIFGDDEEGHYPRTRALVRRIYLGFTRPFKRIGTLLDVVVVITEDESYARRLREDGFLVIQGSPTRDEVLMRAGSARATAMMVLLPNDTDALLTVLTARSSNPDLYITAATKSEELASKTLRVGANNVVQPYELAGKFLNNVTLRPAVYDFFHGILFDQTLNVQTTQITLMAGSGWIGRAIGDLELETRFKAHILGIHMGKDNEFRVVPGSKYVLSEREELIIAAPNRYISILQQSAKEGTQTPPNLSWQRPATIHTPRDVEHRYTLEESFTAIAAMRKHFIVCVNDTVSRNAVDQLDPTRPFVIICQTEADVEHYLERGFRVIHGDPINEQTLMDAGAERALAIMISLDDEADTVLTVMNARSLSKRILVTATANSEEHIRKILRAGADRAINPSSIAAQFVLLTTTRPTVSGFFQHVLYNEIQGIETTELYMQDNSPWIGKTIGGLHLESQFRAHVIGIRQRDGKFEYAPSENYAIKPFEVLIIVTPMDHADDLRHAAHGNETRRPDTLRRSSAISTSVGTNPLRAD
jgi:voltage-gated potassium channel